MNWIRLTDRTPKREEFDADDQVWVINEADAKPVKQLFTYNDLPAWSNCTHWKPTGCTETIKPFKRYETILYARGMTRFGDLAQGSLFVFGDTLALKSDYSSHEGVPKAYIVGTGEMFWGGTSDPAALKELLVQEVRIK